MNNALAKSGTILVLGIVLILNQGCNIKSLKSESDRGSGSVGTKLFLPSGENSSDDTKLPTISGGGSSGELSGFSHNPSEELLAQDGYSGTLTPSGVDPRQ